MHTFSAVMDTVCFFFLLSHVDVSDALKLMNMYAQYEYIHPPPLCVHALVSLRALFLACVKVPFYFIALQLFIGTSQSKTFHKVVFALWNAIVQSYPLRANFCSAQQYIENVLCVCVCVLVP